MKLTNYEINILTNLLATCLDARSYPLHKKH